MGNFTLTWLDVIHVAGRLWDEVGVLEVLVMIEVCSLSIDLAGRRRIVTRVLLGLGLLRQNE